MWKFAFFGLALILFSCSSAPKAPSLTRFDHALDTFDLESQGLHFVFLMAPDCPISQNYTLVVNELQDSLAETDEISLLIPGPFYTHEEIKAFQTKYKVEAPIYIDSSAYYVNMFNGTVTPEVIALDASGNVFYQGKIDDWVERLGTKRQEVTNHYMFNALRSIRSGKHVKPSYVKPIGCLIE